MRLNRVERDERGAYAPAYTAVVTLVTVLLAGILINRVAWTAESINDKAETIKQSAVGIGVDTAAVLNLDATNESASSILVSADPLDQKLKQIVSLAQAVDVKAKSINGSAGTVSGTARDINGTAGTISGTAGGINDRVAAILSQAQSIMRGVDQINKNLDATIAIVTQVRGTTGGIRVQADRADARAACIDGKTPVGSGGSDNQPDCRPVAG
jgi:methyl-accepting chemotaxis protein